MKLSKKKINGFTLIEIIVSIIIIMFLLAIFFANYHSADKRTELNMAAQKMASDIRTVQNNSLGAKIFNSSFPAGGWGIYFSLAEPESYIIFADINNNQAYDASGGELIKTIELPNGVEISSINPSASTAITFLPPDPITYVNGSNTTNAEIHLVENSNDSIKTVRINSFGLIEVLN